MIRNNIDVDLTGIGDETARARFAEDVGTEKPYGNHIIKQRARVVRTTFVQMIGCHVSMLDQSI